jgi:hypothetical protein
VGKNYLNSYLYEDLIKSKRDKIKDYPNNKEKDER